MEKYKMRAMIISSLGLMLLTVGISFSFFNYTRIGNINNLGTGRIYFNSEQNGSLNITNVFPMTSTEAGNANLDTVTVEIQGDTTYANGEEFEISLVDVNNTINGKQVPINYIATYTANTGSSIGTSSETYWTSRDSKNADIYTLNGTDKVEEGKQVLVGYIKNSATGINGTLTIKAYIDADRIAISDTYYENAGLAVTEGGPQSATPSPTLGPNDLYGTTTEWVNGRTVFTTTEWNSFQTSGSPISFKIRAESNEGIWVEKPSKSIESCPGCKYIYRVINPEDETTWLWTTWNMGGSNQTTGDPEPITPTQITSGIYDDYEELIATTGKNYFLGVKLNNNNEVTNAYACGVKDNVPFCLEGTSDGSKYSANSSLINGANLWNNTCTVESNYTECGSWNNSDSLSVGASSGGYVIAGVGNIGACHVNANGYFECHEEPDPGGGGGSPM